MTNRILGPKIISSVSEYIDIDDVSNFFELPRVDINIHLIQSRQEFDKIDGSKTEDWVVGFTKNNTIYIFDPEKFEQYSTHPKSDFGSVLKHEASHIYYKKIKANGYPHWLDEGVACFISGQNKNTPPDKINIKLLKKYYDSVDGKVYGLGQFMVTKIIEEFGKNKLFELIKIDSPDDLYNELRSMFRWLR